MQKKNQFIGIALLGIALVLMAMQSQDQARRAKEFNDAQAKTVAAQQSQAQEERANAKPVQMVTTSTESTAVPVKAVEQLPEEKLTTLQNELVAITFTNRGGAVRSVTFKQYPEALGSKTPLTITAPAALPYLAMGLSGKPDGVDLASYNLVSANNQTIVFARNVAPKLTLERHYTLTQPEAGKRTAMGYLLEQKLVWKNTSATDLQLPAYSVNVGTALPEASDHDNLFLNFAYRDSKEARFADLRHFHGGSFLFWNKPAQESYQTTVLTQWAAVKSKSFTLLTTPQTSATAVYAAPYKLSGETPKETITGAMMFEGPLVKANAETTASLKSYLGPKEYARLAAMTEHQDEIMQWGWPIFAFFSKLFISMLNWLAGVAHNYGVAIILLTLIIRAVMWPFTAAAAKASKKMAAVQPMLKEVQEKYKNNPEKLQRETLRIFQENQVNPLAGCLPALLQIPVFIGFFYMLRSAAELRFESFLWIKDLSMPDTVAHISGFPVNPLPILMLITMYFQIKLTPSSGDPQQQQIMQFTPFLFSFLLYNFSAGLTLYWTLSNLISIIQQIMVNREQQPPSSTGGGVNGDAIDVKATTVKG